MNEKELLLSLKQGNKNAFAAIYQVYWRQVYNFSRLYLYNIRDVEDIVQEVFIKVWEAKEFIDETQHFKNYLFIITRNLIFNKYRKKIYEDFYKVSVLAAIKADYEVEKEIEANDLRKYIDLLIEQLPPQRKRIFNLSRKQGKTYKEIASELGISEKTVENQIREALKYLKKKLYLLCVFLLIG